MSDPSDTVLAADASRRTPPPDPRVRTECVRIARRLHAAQLQVIGLVPAGDDVGVPGLALQLGAAFTELDGSTAAVIDGNARYPATAAGGPAPVDAGALYRCRWVGDSLAVFAPVRRARPGNVLPELVALIRREASAFAHLLVDLTGFHLLGEHASAAAHMDGIILVARAHRCRESDLADSARDLPRDRLLGVLLVD